MLLKTVLPWYLKPRENKKWLNRNIKVSMMLHSSVSASSLAQFGVYSVSLEEEALIIQSYISEEVRHGLPVMDPANGFWEDHADIHSLDFRALEFLYFMWDCVCNNHLQKEKQQSEGCSSFPPPVLKLWKGTSTHQILWSHPLHYCQG